MGPREAQEEWSRNLGLLSQQAQQADQASAAREASFSLEPFALAGAQLQDQPGLDHLFAALHNTSEGGMTPLRLDHLHDGSHPQQQHSYDSEASCDERQHRSMSSDADPAAKKPRISGPSSFTTGEANKSSMCMHTACHRHAMYGFQGVPRFCSFHKEQVRSEIALVVRALPVKSYRYMGCVLSSTCRAHLSAYIASWPCQHIISFLHTGCTLSFACGTLPARLRSAARS
jgi:hypothetical protein